MFSDVVSPPESGYPMYFYQRTEHGMRVVMLKNQTEQVVATCNRISLDGKLKFTYAIEASEYSSSDYTTLLKYFGTCSRQTMTDLIALIGEKFSKIIQNQKKNESDRNN
jgi:hypothetical protein